MYPPIPSYEDICPHGPDDLDAHWAAKHFLHVDRAQASAMMEERRLQCYCEDLASMGIQAFEYYLYAIQDYLKLTYNHYREVLVIRSAKSRRDFSAYFFHFRRSIMTYSTRKG